MTKEKTLSRYPAGTRTDPKNSGRLENPGNLNASVHNPLCGDELELSLALSGKLIQDCRAMVRGCFICQASASIMSEMIIKKTLQEAIITGRLFDESLRKDNEDVPKMVEPLRPFLALKKHRSRIKCMKLAWDALEECANQDKNLNHT
ncbi:MAG: iron-sulfur cluster assembly scaffold protein [Pseudomonadota bacterium]|nr:MAG: iron-sulfur cluster assembly scaffold protein [Pseudomonadota bacterium]